MIVKTAHYFEDFYCLADQCPNTCCANWNIPIDRQTRDHYMELEGEMGELARRVLKGETFKNQNDRCPFLQENGLCSMILAANGSQEDLSYVCRTYPRKIANYGNERHISLSVSCPMAARLLMQCRDGIQFIEKTVDEPPMMNSIDPAWFRELLQIRQNTITIVQSKETSLCKNIDKLLEEYQIKQKGRSVYKQSHGLIRLFLLLRYNDPSMKETIRALCKKSQLKQALAHWQIVFDQHQMLFENLLVYMLDRYVMEAVDDGKFAPRIALCVAWCRMLYLLVCNHYAQHGSIDDTAMEELIVAFSRQTEHCDQNLIRLMRFSRWVL